MRRHAAVAVLMVILGALVSPSPVSAGGTMLKPVQDRYEGGDVATLVAYTQWDGQPLPTFAAYLRVAGHDSTVRREPTDVALGPLRMERTGQGGYLAVRASITFRVPTDLVPSRYEVMICHDACPGVVGTIFGGELWIGVGPAYTIQREWALDDPEIANLPGEASLTGPGFRTTAASVRSGWVPPSTSADHGRATPPVAPAPPAPGPVERAGAAVWPWALLTVAAALVTARMAGHAVGGDPRVHGRRWSGRQAASPPSGSLDRRLRAGAQACKGGSAGSL